MLYNPTVSPQPKLPSSCPKLPSSPNEATVVRYFGQICLPSSRGESFGDYCTKTRKGTSLSFWCKVYHASVFLCCKFERDRWSQRSMGRQKLLEASGRVGAILTTVASCGCPQWSGYLWGVLLLPSAACALGATGEKPVNHRFTGLYWGLICIEWRHIHDDRLNRSDHL